MSRQVAMSALTSLAVVTGDADSSENGSDLVARMRLAT